MTITKLKYMPYAQAHTEVDGSDGLRFRLVSYNTPILDVMPQANGKNRFHIIYNPTCTATTRKHVSAFLKEYAPHTPYQTIKDHYNTNCNVFSD